MRRHVLPFDFTIIRTCLTLSIRKIVSPFAINSLSAMIISCVVQWALARVKLNIALHYININLSNFGIQMYLLFHRW